MPYAAAVQALPWATSVEIHGAPSVRSRATRWPAASMTAKDMGTPTRAHSSRAAERRARAWSEVSTGSACQRPRRLRLRRGRPGRKVGRSPCPTGGVSVPLYAPSPALRGRQLAADVGLLAWLVLWVLVARTVHGAVLALAEPGRAVEHLGTSVAGSMSSAAEAAEDVPVVEIGRAS